MAFGLWWTTWAAETLIFKANCHKLLFEINLRYWTEYLIRLRSKREISKKRQIIYSATHAHYFLLRRKTFSDNCWVLKAPDHFLGRTFKIWILYIMRESSRIFSRNYYIKRSLFKQIGLFLLKCKLSTRVGLPKSGDFKRYQKLAIMV